MKISLRWVASRWPRAVSARSQANSTSITGRPDDGLRFRWLGHAVHHMAKQFNSLYLLLFTFSTSSQVSQLHIRALRHRQVVEGWQCDPQVPPLPPPIPTGRTPAVVPVPEARASAQSHKRGDRRSQYTERYLNVGQVEVRRPPHLELPMMVEGVRRIDTLDGVDRASVALNQLSHTATSCITFVIHENSHRFFGRPRQLDPDPHSISIT